VILQCTLDGLLLDAFLDQDTWTVTAFDGDECFTLEAVEALYYQLWTATEDEWFALQGRYRLLRPAADFRFACHRPA
jgi:hypothetical protein